MRALVLGGTGMLGRAVVAAGRRRGATVVGLARAQADVRDPERLAWWAREIRPDVMINCAAYTRVDDAERERDLAFAVNGEAVGHVRDAARSVGARLVHVSTDYVFPGDATEPYPVAAPVGPRSVYGASKLEGERQALADDRAVVVRTSWLFGPGGPHFVDTMVRLIEAGRTPLRVVADQVGCPTYTPFLARALWELAEHPEAAGLFHYSNREPLSWHGFASEIARQWAPEVEVVPVATDEFPRPAPRPAYSVLDPSRFERLVGRRVEPWIWGLSRLLSRRSPRRTSEGDEQ